MRANPFNHGLRILADDCERGLVLEGCGVLEEHGGSIRRYRVAVTSLPNVRLEDAAQLPPPRGTWVDCEGKVERLYSGELGLILVKRVDGVQATLCMRPEGCEDSVSLAIGLVRPPDVEHLIALHHHWRAGLRPLGRALLHVAAGLTPIEAQVVDGGSALAVETMVALRGAPPAEELIRADHFDVPLDEP